MMKFCAGLLLAAAGLLGSPVLAQNAPKQLYNKTVVIHWNESLQQRRPPDTRIFNAQVTAVRTAYVSNAGRVFIRASRSNKSGGRKDETAPDSRAAGTLVFQGNMMVGTSAFEGGARQTRITFDPSFNSCTASVVYGKSGDGPIRWKSWDGNTYETLEANISAVSCSIRDGNAFAEQ
ncbi:MAG: hypothetical protein HY242_06275 [Afipia sp.]|nr:hypothetical protein [Afipia sp.]